VCGWGACCNIRVCLCSFVLVDPLAGSWEGVSCGGSAVLKTSVIWGDVSRDRIEEKDNGTCVIAVNFRAGGSLCEMWAAVPEDSCKWK